MKMEEMIYSIRGAITTDFDSPASIDEAVKLMMEELYKRNHITDSDISFILFSQTIDLKSRNAAAAFRATGKGAAVPLFCVQEAEIAGSLARVIRVLVQINHPKKSEPVMVYLKGAAALRPDLHIEEELDL